MEGQLNIQRLNCLLPIGCDKNCQVSQTVLTGGAGTKESWFSLTHLEKVLEGLNGKEIKITIEWNEKESINLSII